MNRSIKHLALVGLVAFSLSACGSKPEQTEEVKTTPAPSAQTEETGVITSIKNALTGSATIKCNYTDEDGEVSVVYLKEKMVRVQAAETNDDGSTFNIEGLIRDNKAYLWSDTSTEGWVFDYSQIDAEGGGMTMGDRAIHSSDDVIDELEAKGENCEKTSVPSDFFEIPSNITWPQQN